ncbi:MAG: hypothetical protein M1830_001035 [Pleopsidium flavum]|nr:MAG: hypothetical protein M1830_001035 [Pleopsidium flavum]
MNYEMESSRSRGSMRQRYGRDRGHGGDSKGRHASRRSLDSRHYNGEDGYDATRERNYGHRPRHRPTKMELQPAIGGLYDILSDAHSLYEEFNHDYEEETRGIRRYAGPELLDKLWTLRAKMSDQSISHDPHGPPEGGPDHEGQPNDLDLGSDLIGFRGSVEAIRKAFEMVMNAAPASKRSMSHRSTTEAEGLSRMMKKLDSAFQDINQLSRGAHKRPTHLQELLKEIDLVLGYLDKSRNLWQPDAGRCKDDRPHHRGPEEYEKGKSEVFQETEQCE